MSKAETRDALNPAQRITNQIADVPGWRGKMLARLRKLILQAAPGITEDWKWGTAVWSQRGLVCSVGVFKDHVKLTFFKGAALPDPRGAFNAGRDAKTMRSIDIREGDAVDETAVKELVRAAVELNFSGHKGDEPKRTSARPAAQPKADGQPESDLPAGLAQPARRALAGAGIKRLDQLARHTQAEVKALHGIGPNALKQLEQALSARGLSFKKARRAGQR